MSDIADLFILASKHQGVNLRIENGPGLAIKAILTVVYRGYPIQSQFAISARDLALTSKMGIDYLETEIHYKLDRAIREIEKLIAEMGTEQHYKAGTASIPPPPAYMPVTVTLNADSDKYAEMIEKATKKFFGATSPAETTNKQTRPPKKWRADESPF